MKSIPALVLLAATALSACSAPPAELASADCPSPRAAPTLPASGLVEKAAFCMTAEELAPRNTQTITCGDTRLVVFDWRTDFTHSVRGIHFNGADGKVVRPSIFHSGSFEPLCNQDRFVLMSDDTHFEPGPSFVMRGDGTVVAKLDFAWDPYFTASDDEKIFWIETHEGGATKETRLQVFDVDGKRLFEHRYREVGNTVEITHGDQTYHITVKDPALPG